MSKKSKVRGASAASETLSVRLSQSDLAQLDRRAKAQGLARGPYAKRVLVDHVRPLVGERSLGALAALLRAASIASRNARDPELARRLEQLCHDALGQIRDDLQ